MMNVNPHDLTYDCLQSLNDNRKLPPNRTTNRNRPYFQLVKAVNAGPVTDNTTELFNYRSGPDWRASKFRVRARYKEHFCEARNCITLQYYLPAAFRSNVRPTRRNTIAFHCFPVKGTAGRHGNRDFYVSGSCLRWVLWF